MDNLPYTVLIPAAGESKRFKNVGITKPKGLLEMTWRDRTATMIEHCMPHDLDIPIRVACRQEDYALFHRALRHRNILFTAMQNATRGQAHTCALMSQGVQVQGAVVVINSDNGFDVDPIEFVSACEHAGANAGAMVFVASGERKYGYVSDHPFFDFGMEKAPISSFALAGMFYFKSVEILQLAYSLAFRPDNGEEYLSQLFGVIPKPKFAYRLPRAALHEWGTPIDLLADTTVTVIDKEWANRKVVAT